VINERGTSQLLHSESDSMKTFHLFAMVLYYIDFVSGEDSKDVIGYCNKKQFYKNLWSSCVL